MATTYTLTSLTGSDISFAPNFYVPAQGGAVVQFLTSDMLQAIAKGTVSANPSAPASTPSGNDSADIAALFAIVTDLNARLSNLESGDRISNYAVN